MEDVDNDDDDNDGDATKASGYVTGKTNNNQTDPKVQHYPANARIYAYVFNVPFCSNIRQVDGEHDRHNVMSPYDHKQEGVRKTKVGAEKTYNYK